jgi:3-deoxy-manno-octulosonate cytidylyltransferase (CMP-KDO synthetase)
LVKARWRKAEVDNFRVIIPARFASTRLPGKPLLPLAGKPMIAHVWEHAQEAGASEVWVATDDSRIAEAVENLGGRVLMTSAAHVSGTDRLAEVASLLRLEDHEILVNLQGDEPLIPGALLAQLAASLSANLDCGLATMATPIREARDVFDPNVVKTVLDDLGRALYFSRAPIPWHRAEFAAGTSRELLPEGTTFLRHLGLYAYRVGTLRQIASAPVAMLERTESLEQLRALAMGTRIHVTVLDEVPGHGVDTVEDLVRVEGELMRERH